MHIALSKMDLENAIRAFLEKRVALPQKTDKPDHHKFLLVLEGGDTTPLFDLVDELRIDLD